jgi:hypothetical protein
LLPVSSKRFEVEEDDEVTKEHEDWERGDLVESGFFVGVLC